MFPSRDTFEKNALRWVLSISPKQTPIFYDSSATRIIGHRGYTASAPENTIQACLDAFLQLGAHGVEIDVKCSLDGQPFVFHDEVLWRMTGSEEVASEMPLSQLQALRLKGGVSLNSDTIPTLGDFLDAMPSGTFVNIEIKDYPPAYHGFEKTIIRLMQQHSARLTFVVSSFDPRVLMRLRKLNAQVPLGLLIGPEQIWFLRYGFLIPLVLPHAIHPHHTMIDGALVRGAHAKNIRIHTWTVNGLDRAVQLADPVDAIITDRTPAMVNRF